ncbi:hypothetical protein ACIBTV_30590 [Micromonospora sp. NPDC049366]|uniref:hypothetical protein n=1 Tax=Micromonospora sp. NPDC049366 TaxID=3364271 RepID=UPI0037A0E322
MDRPTTMTALLKEHLPELGAEATLFSLQTMVLAGALSAYARPHPACRRPTGPNPAWPASTWT